MFVLLPFRKYPPCSNKYYYKSFRRESRKKIIIFFASELVLDKNKLLVKMVVEYLNNYQKESSVFIPQFTTFNFIFTLIHYISFP